MTFRAACILILLLTVTTSADARLWTDVTGLYTIEADLIGFNDESVILQRENQELGAFPLEKLSPTDRAYLKSKEALDIHAKSIDSVQTWTSKDGLKVVGRIIGYTQRSMTFQKRLGQVYVNDTPWENIPELYRAMMPEVVGFTEKQDLADEAALMKWIDGLGGQAMKLDLEGVVFEFENGKEYGIPFFMFSAKDQQILKPGYDAWLKDHTADEKTDDDAFRLESLAAAYQQNEKVNQQIAIMNLNMQAIQSGLTQAWEVTLYPQAGNPYPPRWVVALGRNSLEATQNALRQNPGFVDGPVRRVSRRR